MSWYIWKIKRIKLLMDSADKVAGMNGADFSIDFGGGRLNLLKLLQ